MLGGWPRRAKHTNTHTHTHTHTRTHIHTHARAHKRKGHTHSIQPAHTGISGVSGEPIPPTLIPIIATADRATAEPPSSPRAEVLLSVLKDTPWQWPPALASSRQTLCRVDRSATSSDPRSPEAVGLPVLAESSSLLLLALPSPETRKHRIEVHPAAERPALAAGHPEGLCEGCTSQGWPRPPQMRAHGATPPPCSPPAKARRQRPQCRAPPRAPSR